MGYIEVEFTTKTYAVAGLLADCYIVLDCDREWIKALVF